MATIELTKEVLTKAAKMRDEGATWNEIREFTGTKLGSSQFLKRWDAAGISYRPSGAPKPGAAKATAKPAPATATKKATKPAKKATPAKRKVTVKKTTAQPHREKEAEEKDRVAANLEAAKYPNHQGRATVKRTEPTETRASAGV